MASVPPFFFWWSLMGWTDNDTFEFWMPLQAVEKSNTEVPDKRERKIRGIASTSSRDLQGEIVEQSGIDTSYFTNYGYFNYDHKDGSENKVGEPTVCRVTKNGLYVEGIIYQNKAVADHVWEHMTSLSQTPNTKRKMGFSIQGKVKRRQGKVIKECWIQDIAITPSPVNTSTWAEIAKSLSSQEWDFSKDEEDADKALSIGASSPVVPESLNRKVKDTHGKEETIKSLSFLESVGWIQSTTGMSSEAAMATARAIFAAYSQEK